MCHWYVVVGATNVSAAMIGNETHDLTTMERVEWSSTLGGEYYFTSFFSPLPARCIDKSQGIVCKFDFSA